MTVTFRLRLLSRLTYCTHDKDFSNTSECEKLTIKSVSATSNHVMSYNTYMITGYCQRMNAPYETISVCVTLSLIFQIPYFRKLENSFLQFVRTV